MSDNRAIPRHIGFIMDGNGRWAKARNKPRSYGHQKGADVIHEIVGACFDRGIKVVSLYAFSTENWSRPKEEVDQIFNILEKFLKRYSKEMLEKHIRLVISGDVNGLPEKLRKQCLKKVKETENFTEYTLNIAINYGSRAEIVYAVNRLIAEGKTKITEEDLSGAMYTKGLCDLDYVVRTSGEMRLSNFFMWQCAYAELYFTNVFWPDFHEKQLDEALDEYSRRGRRFGGIDNKADALKE